MCLLRIGRGRVRFSLFERRARHRTGHPWSNARHRTVGHLFQGRFKAILVDRDAYLTELIRYIVRNPVAANMVDSLDDYRWSSHQTMISRKKPPEWFAKEDALKLFTQNRSGAVGVYRAFVEKTAFNYDDHLRQQIYMGDQAFVDRMLALTKADPSATEVPGRQRSSPVTIAELDKGQGRDELIRVAYQSGIRLKEIADHVGLHYSTVSRIARMDAR